MKWIAEECGIKNELGEKGKAGILRDMASRAEFLRLDFSIHPLTVRQTHSSGRTENH